MHTLTRLPGASDFAFDPESNTEQSDLARGHTSALS